MASFYAIDPAWRVRAVCLFGAASLLLSACQPTAPTGGAEPVLPEPVVASPDKASPAPVYPLVAEGEPVAYSPNLWGANNNYLFLPYAPESPVYPEVAGPLQFRVLRFPGGSSSNAYHWESGGYDNWFFNERIVPALASFPPERQLDVAQNRNILTVEDCAVVMDALGTEPIVVFNVLHPPQESRSFAQALKDEGIDLKYAELGNELYYAGYEKWTGKPEAFMPKLRAHADAIRAVFPGVCIAVPVGGNHHGYATVAGAVDEQLDDKTRANLERAEAWNAALAADPFFDAVIVHHYAGYRIPEVVDKGVAKTDQNDTDSQYDALFYEAEDSPAWLTERFSRQFPGKKLLLTEWGVLHKVEPWFQNWAHGLFVADFLLNLAAQGEVWDLSCYHILTGRRFELFYPIRATNKSWTGEIARTIPYFVMEELGAALTAHDRIQKLTIPGLAMAGSGDYRYAPVAAWLLSGGEGGGQELLAVNLSGRPVTVSLQGLGLRTSMGQGTVLSCPGLDASLGAAHRPKADAVADIPVRSDLHLAGEELVLPAYSLVSLRIP